MFTFFRLPKCLVNNVYFAELSADAKLLYEMQWGGRHEINLPEFPDVTFRWTYGEMMAVTGNEITSLYTGMPIWNDYFCDLTGDGFIKRCRR